MGADQFFFGANIAEGGALSRHEPHAQLVFFWGRGEDGGEEGRAKPEEKSS